MIKNTELHVATAHS